MFFVNAYSVPANDSSQLTDTVGNSLVDCGATTHIICDKEKIISVNKKLIIKIMLLNWSMVPDTVLLLQLWLLLSMLVVRSTVYFVHDDLCIPSYKQDTLSVQAATGNGASVSFKPGSAKMKASNGNVRN